TYGIDDWASNGLSPDLNPLDFSFGGMLLCIVFLLYHILLLDNVQVLDKVKDPFTSDYYFQTFRIHPIDFQSGLSLGMKSDSKLHTTRLFFTPVINYSTLLLVSQPITEILGGPDLFINKGSTINLTCLVRYAPEPPPLMLWSHNREVINFDSPRGGISLVTEKGPVTTSRLLIQKAIPSDTGLYTCDPSNANPASVRVHILNGEHPAAMYHGPASIPLSPSLSALTVLVLIQTTIWFPLHISTKVE
ncbi:hypothetical protein L9F63_027407, partial [Diploptera punctata]